MTDHRIDEYLALPYTVEVVQDSTGDYSGYVVRVVELPGCMTQVDSFAELDEMLREAMQLWLEMRIESGQPVPEPRPVEEFSGKFVVRLPKSLHRELTSRAEQEGVSLNALVNVALAQYAGEAGAASKRHRTNGGAVYPQGSKRGVGRSIHESSPQQRYDAQDESKQT